MSEVISEEYRKQQMELHKNPNYGVASLKFAPIVADLIRMFKFRSVSDYGAGKQNLLKGLTEAGITGSNTCLMIRLSRHTDNPGRRMWFAASMCWNTSSPRS